MSTALAVSYGVASAIMYGASTTVQHRLAQQSTDSGQVSAAGLRSLLRRPLFLFAMIGDGLGFLLQIIALSIGSVVIVQPLVVLMLPVSLAVAFLFDRRRPARGEWFGVLGVLGGLTTFLLAIGHPTGGRPAGWHATGLALAVLLVLGALTATVVKGRSRVVRAATFGAVAGWYFGGLAVMVDAASSWVSVDGYEGLLESPSGLVPIAGIVVLGAGGLISTQVSFQIGALGATLPASLAVDPLVAVLLGVILLHERLPISLARVGLYLVCLAAVLAGAIRLANPATRRDAHDAQIR